MKKTPIVLVAAGLLMATWSSCKKDEQSVSPPLPGNEFMTTVKLVATNVADTDDVATATWVDLTPDDANPPDTTNALLNLRANAVYNVQVQFLDETQSPAGDITEEIRERANYHLICFENSPGLNLSIERTDHDTNVPALEVGLTDKFTTGSTGSGTLEVMLRHQPNAKNGSCEPGSTDADVTYHINIH